MQRQTDITSRTGSLLTDIVSILSDPEPGDLSARLPSEVWKATMDSDDGSSRPGYAGRAVVVPLAGLARDLTVGTASAGGNLVGAPVGNPIGSLVGYSVVGRAGATVLDVPAGNPEGIPYTDTAPEAVFVASEGGAATQSEPSFGLAPVAPVTIAVQALVSRRIMKMAAPVHRQLIQRELVKAMMRGLDKAALQGSGSSGEPTGLVNAGDVHAQSGTSLAWAGVQSMVEAVLEAGVEESRLTFVGDPGARKVLAQRERAAGSGFIWDTGRIDLAPAHVSRQAPATSLFLGDFSNLRIVIHGGLTVIVDPRVDVTGKHRIVMLMDVDVLVPRGEEFAKATSIT